MIPALNSDSDQDDSDKTTRRCATIALGQVVLEDPEFEQTRVTLPKK